MSTRMSFNTTCVYANGNDINEMIDNAKDISRRTFLRYVNKVELTEIEHQLGYSQEFHMCNDWHVSYSKSTFKGKPCVYFTWSSIEHIFS